MPNSRTRKKNRRQAEEQRRKLRRQSTASTLEGGVPEFIGSDRHCVLQRCSSFDAHHGKKVEKFASPEAMGVESNNDGLISSAYSWFSYGLDCVMPSRKLARELEETKQRLRTAEDQLRKEKVMTRMNFFSICPSSLMTCPSL